MHRMQTGTLTTMGNPLYARNTAAQAKLFYHAYLQRRELTSSELAGLHRIPEIHETPKKKRTSQGALLYVRGIR